MRRRILADENVPRRVVEALRALGDDVAWMREDAPGSTDLEVIARAKVEDRMVLTFDKDFGELASRGAGGDPPALILLRLRAPPAALADAVAAALQSRDDWSGSISVIEAGRIRM